MEADIIELHGHFYVLSSIKGSRKAEKLPLHQYLKEDVNNGIHFIV